MTDLLLHKHHGLGNDFVVTITTRAAAPHRDDDAFAVTARRICDRRTGVGADGWLIAYIDDPADTAVAGELDTATMVLYNADGSRAEMSGNGIRCLVHALVRHGGSPHTWTIDTDAGRRRVEVAPGDDPLDIVAIVEMGEVALGAEPIGWRQIGIDPARPVAHLSLGNPHTVVPVEDVGAVDLAGLGRRVPEVNLEIVEPTAHRHVVRMRVHERGAGITSACGTGACATAVAAARWGLATPLDGKVVVEMDGGSATVFIDDEGPNPTVRLQGPSTFVADITIPAR